LLLLKEGGPDTAPDLLQVLMNGNCMVREQQDHQKLKKQGVPERKCNVEVVHEFISRIGLNCLNPDARFRPHRFRAFVQRIVLAGFCKSDGNPDIFKQGKELFHDSSLQGLNIFLFNKKAMQMPLFKMMLNK
jgi:hypothetical protein